MIYIGLSGYARSGKDSIADALVEHYNKPMFPAVKMPLANKLKEYCERAFGLTSSGSAAKDPVRRAAYQFMGQLGRDVHPDLWIDLMRLNVLDYCYKECIQDYWSMTVVIPDIRHHNELDFLFKDKNNGMCFAIDADIRMRDMLKDPIYQHKSEIDIPNLRKRIWDVNTELVLVNNEEADLNKAIAKAIDMIDPWIAQSPKDVREYINVYENTKKHFEKIYGEEFDANNNSRVQGFY